MDTVIYTREAAMAKANVVKASIDAGAKLRMFKSGLTLTQFTTRDQLLAAECDFDGYTAGGYTCAPFTGPLISTAGGAELQSLLVNVAYGPAGDPAVGNDVGGYWIEDDETTPRVRIAVQYNPARNLAAVGQGWGIVLQMVEGRNAPTPAPEA